MTSISARHDLLVQQLAIINRRIGWALDRKDPRLFAIACQHREQVQRRLETLACEPVADEDEAESS